MLISCFAINYGYSQIPEDATIDPSQIEYWVGEGSNEAVVIISWCSNAETALAWGYRFDGEANLLGVLNAIAAEDSRLTIIGGAPSNITYQDDVYDLTMCTNPNAEWGDDDYDIPMFGFNGVMGQVSFSAQSIVNGDIVKVGGYACAFMSDDWTGISWTTPVIPASDPNGGNSSIDNYTSNNTLNVYPNPCQSAIYMDVEQGEVIALFNAEGMMVSQKVADSEQVSFNMQSYASGIYFVKSGSQTVKVVKL